MYLKFKVDATNLETRLRKNQNIIAKMLIRDAAEYLARKIREEIISGQFVGVITGNLRANTKVDFQNGKYSIISEMDYTKHVLNRTAAKFGQNYLDIAVNLYGGNLETIIREEAKKVYRKKYVYQNPFP